MPSKKRGGLSKKEFSQKAQKKALMNVGSYPKGDYRQGMPKKQANLKKMKKNKVISSLD